MAGKRMDIGSLFRRARVAALLAIVVAGGACNKEARLADARRDGGSNLLLITLDTTRADRIGAYGDSRAATPAIDRLAREGVRFERAYTAAPLTLPAHVTLMTGREPQAHQVRNNGTYSLRPEETTLAEILRQAGFSTMAMIAAYVLEKKFGLDQGFDGYDDKLNTSGEATTFRSEITADRVYDKFSRWLKSAPASPFFCWVHLYDPHHPYEPPEEFRRRFPDDPYRGEVAYMDEVIGRMLRDLDSRGLLENTLVVVAGDHGEGFGEHGESGHGVFCYEETLRVPLIFRQPRLFRGGRVVVQPVGLVDILPTLLELYRLPLPAELQGRSIAPLLTADEDPANPARVLYFESLYGMEVMGWAPLSGLVRGPLKYISLPRSELYDLAADPREEDNLYLKKNVQAKGLARELDHYLEKTVNADQAALRPRQSRQDQDRLRALGYLAAGGPTPRAGSSADPKDGIGTMNLLLEARQAVHAGDLDGAQRQIAALRATGIDRTLPQFHDMCYELALARKDPAAIEAALREAIARFPDTSRFVLLLAAFFRNRGDARRTEEMARLVLARDPKAVEAHLLLGELYRGQKRIDKAIGHFQQAWDLEPGDHKLAIALADMNIETGHPEQALAALRKLIQAGQVPGSPLAVEIRAQASKLLVSLGQPDLAESLLQDLVREQRGNPAHWTQLGLAQLDRGQADQAIRSFQQALQLDPKQALALSGLGTLHLNLFRQRRDRRGLQLAAGFFSRALEADARLITAVNGLGVVYLYLGDSLKAIEQFRLANAIDPGFVNAYFNLAIAQLSAGRRVEARKTLNTLRQKLAGRLSAAEREQLTALLREANN
jgi:arylsulfatase A-like enzyme/Tfp pilus assembly protein PilF